MRKKITLLFIVLILLGISVVIIYQFSSGNETKPTTEAHSNLQKDTLERFLEASVMCQGKYYKDVLTSHQKKL